MLESDEEGRSQGLHNVEELEHVYELQVRFQSASFSVEHLPIYPQPWMRFRPWPPTLATCRSLALPRVCAILREV